MGHTSLHFCSSSCAPQFGQVRSIFSISDVLDVPVVMRLIILLFFSEILCKMTEYCRGIRRPALKCRNTTRTAPASPSFNTHNDVLIEKSAFLQETHSRFRRELVRSEFAHAD